MKINNNKINQNRQIHNNPNDEARIAFLKRVLCVTLPTFAGIGAGFGLAIAGIGIATPFALAGPILLGALVGALLGFAILAIYRNYVK